MAGMGTASNTDRDRWNRRYIERPWTDDPSPWLLANADSLPEPGRCLDVAGGTGRNALWLADRGWDVTVIDVSDVALALAADRARSLRLPLTTHLVDLSAEPLPEGPWALIMVFHYLDRALFSDIALALAPGGVVVGALATTTNLARNESPAGEHLLADGELPDLMGDFDLVRYEEGWQDDRHDARFLARCSLSVARPRTL